MKRIFISLIFTLIFLVHYGDGSCFLPSDLKGAWYSSRRGTLNFTDTATLTTIPIYPTSKFGDLKLSCYLSSGENYALKSDSFSFLGLDFEVFTCLKIQKISNVKYIYYEYTTINTDADNERLKSELVSTGSSPTLSSICDRTSAPAGSENILLKNDGNEESSGIRFPYNFRGKWSYTYTNSGSTYCVNDSKVDVCLTEAAKTMVYDYTKCSTIQAYSASGRLKCMYSSSDSSYTYVHVYNADPTTDESTTYRFTCYVISRSGLTLSATQYPQICDSAQTSTSVTSPGAQLVYTQTASCPYDESTSVISMASAAGIAVGLLLLIIIIVCAVLIWYYYKKRKERENEKSLLQKAHPANKRLANGTVFVDGKSRGSKTPRAMNGDTKFHIETDPGVRRENSIHISMTSRQGSGLDGLDGERRNGPAPVEMPEVNDIYDDVIVESEEDEENDDEEFEMETPHETTFLPLTPHERNQLHFTDAEIREIERSSAVQNKETEQADNDMDRIDDELGLPRLSRAFTPIIQPEEATLPAVAYKKMQLSESESEDDKRPDGIKKVKLKKRSKKKRIHSSKGNIKGVRPGSRQIRSESMRETPFLERIKKQENEKTELEQREKLEKEMRDIENEVIKARFAKTVQESSVTPSSKYMVDRPRDSFIRSANKRSSVSAASGTERRRFGDPPAENTSKNRKRTPRIRHPMEVQGGADEHEGQEEVLKKAEEFWKEEKRARSGRRREHPEALPIPSLKEDPFDHRDDKTPGTSSRPETRPGKSAFSVRPTTSSTAFFEPQKESLNNAEELWQRASHLWHLTNRPIWNNLANH